MIAKPWYQSRSVIGGLVASLAGTVALFGLEVDQPALTDLLISAGGLIGGALAIWGRIRAEPPIRVRAAKSDEAGPDSD